ncbi:MAG: DUF378 domain-containing protein [Alphaproteobacteria bacterium]|nr:DUF378 domain-containing protein [Alphaproteobacteria bacterium]
MDWISKGVIILIIVGGMNWGLVGAFNFDLIAFLFGQMTTLTRIVYILVGLSSVWALVSSIYPTNDSAQ